jgi:hypothetical protein
MKTNIMTKKCNDLPMYTPALAGRLVGIAPGRVKRWLQGYEYTYLAHENFVIGKKEPVVHRSKSEFPSYATFLDLIDLLFVKQFLSKGISLQKTRKALLEAESLVGGHHFAQRSFFTDGKNIYIKVKEQGNAILELLSGGQWVIAEIIEQLAEQIEFDSPSGLATQWYPLGKNVPVVIDPKISFGRPSIVGHGTITSNIYDLYLAENANLPVLSS